MSSAQPKIVPLHSHPRSGGHASPSSAAGAATSPKPPRQHGGGASRRGSNPPERTHSRVPARKTLPPPTEQTGRRREDLMRFTLHSELTSLVEEVDKRVLVQLRDGRTLVGTLRLFDQFANIVLTETVERFHIGGRFGDVPLGMYLIKGESVVLLGEVDEEKDAALPGRLEESQIPEAYKEAEALRHREMQRRARLLDFDADV